MSQSEVLLEGTLKADGTLELDQRPKLPPGRVRVALQPVESAAQPSPPEELGDFLQRTRRELEAAGSHFMNEEEVRAHIDWLQDPDKIDELLRQTNQRRRSDEDRGC